MRFTPLLTLALPALAVAQEQKPLGDRLKDWFGKAQDYVQSAASVATEAAQAPADAGAAKVAEHQVTPLAMDNYKSVIQHSGLTKPGNPPEAWMVYVTGGNKTCHGLCVQADRAWNESVALFSADPSAPKVASINCEQQEVLCGAWATTVPSIWFILRPQPLPDQSSATTDITIHPLNATTVSSTDITRIHTRKTYLYEPKYQGALHPFDGWVAKYNLTEPMAYGLFYFSKIPSWAMMIGISLFSRTFMNKRMPQARPAGQPAAAPAAAN